MSTDPQVAEYFRKVSAHLPRHPFFKPSSKKPKGKPRALAQCQDTIALFLKGGIAAIAGSQAQLEFILSLCRGRGVPEKIEVPSDLLSPIAESICGRLQVEFYQRPDKPEAGWILHRIPPGQKPFPG